MAFINACVNAGASLLRHSPSIAHLLSLPRLFSTVRNPIFADVTRAILNVANNSADTAAKALPNDKAYSHSPEDCTSIVGVRFDSKRRCWTAHWKTADGKKKSFTRSVSKHGFLQAEHMAEQARTEAVAAGARTREHVTQKIRKVLGDTAFSADIKAGAAQHHTACIGSGASHRKQRRRRSKVHSSKEALKRFHPDVYKEQGAEQKMVLISQAYDILSDAEAKAAYDVVLQKTPQLKAMKTAMEAHA